MTDNDEVEGVRLELVINRVVPTNIQTRFANDLVIQHQSEHFILSFFEMIPPLIIADTTDELREAYGTIGEIEAKCVARIVVTPRMVKQFIETMTKNLQKYELHYGVSLDVSDEELDG